MGEFAGAEAAVLTAAGAAQDVGGMAADDGFFADAFRHGGGVAGGWGVDEFHGVWILRLGCGYEKARAAGERAGWGLILAGGVKRPRRRPGR